MGEVILVAGEVGPATGEVSLATGEVILVAGEVGPATGEVSLATGEFCPVELSTLWLDAWICPPPLR